MLKSFFEPRSVAVVGASREAGKIGHDVLKNLIQYGFRGKIYPINPNADEVLGLTCYPSVCDAPGEVELAVVVVPAKIAVKVIEDCAKKNVKAAIIISAGFKETGREGAALEREIVQLAHKHDMRVVGPNCLGLINTTVDLNASFAAGMPHKGGVAFFSQSGAFGTAVLDWAIGEQIGFSKFISVGNKADVDETDLIEAIGTDEESQVLLGYLEGVADGPKFMRIAKRISRKKAIIVFKSGGSEAGARAASSHTGALAGSDKAYDAAFQQTGVLRARKVVDLFDWGLAFSYQRGIKGARVAIVTNAGGPGIIATDAVEDCALSMARLSQETTDVLRELLPPTASIYNPIDVIGDAKPDRYEVAVNAALADRNVDGLIVILTPQTSTECVPTAQVIAKAAGATDKPVLACFMGGPGVVDGTKLLMEKHVPTYPFPERAVAAMDAMYRQYRWMEKPGSYLAAFEVNKARVEAVFDKALAAGRLELGEQEARDVVAAYGFRLAQSELATTADEAVAAARTIGLPVVMKISSPDILHKSDVGGVRVGLETEPDVADAYRVMMANIPRHRPKARIDGVLVQEMIPGGREIIIGMTRDPQFGPMLMFGLGGIYVEVLKDVSFRIAPVTFADAKAMINEIRSIGLLKGARGQEPADMDAISDGILRLSQLVTDFPQVVELDINPFRAFDKGKGAIALDARLTLATPDDQPG